MPDFGFNDPAVARTTLQWVTVAIVGLLGLFILVVLFLWLHRIWKCKDGAGHLWITYTPGHRAVKYCTKCERKRRFKWRPLLPLPPL